MFEHLPGSISGDRTGQKSESHLVEGQTNQTLPAKGLPDPTLSPHRAGAGPKFLDGRVRADVSARTTLKAHFYGDSMG